MFVDGARCSIVAWYRRPISDGVANFILKCYREKALAERAVCADELAAASDGGAAVWRRVTDTVVQLENETPPRRLH